MPFVYKSVNSWRTIHPQTTVVTTLGSRDHVRRRVLVLRAAPSCCCSRCCWRFASASKSGAPSSIGSIWRTRTDDDDATACQRAVLGAAAGVPAVRRCSRRRGQREFVPLDQLPPTDSLPAAPLLIAAYAFVWAVLMVYLWSIWRRLGKVETEMRTLAAAKRRRKRAR